MKRLLIVLFAVLPWGAFAQSCDCAANFDYLVDHVQKDYAGFRDKAKDNLGPFTAALRKKAGQAVLTDSCYVVLRSWTNYFKDSHLRVQLDWRYREKYPETARLLNKRFARPVPVRTESSATRTALRVLDERTVLLSLPSFLWEEKKTIDSLLKAYQAQLKRTPHWIIDLRGNDGGTDYTFSSLLPYVSSGPVTVRTDEFLSSEDNIRVLRENLGDKDLSQPAKAYLTGLIALMEQHPGQFVNPSGKASLEIKLDSVHAYPVKVAILIDRNTASSAESFLLNVMQSKKVKVYGENSYGMLDYNNTQYFDIPCKDLNLVIPIGRSKRLPLHPIDNIGIAPDVRISAAEPDKINYIRQALTR